MRYLFVLFFLFSCQHKAINQNTNHSLVKVGTRLNEYRESLASGVNKLKKIDKNVFKSTCMPVGKKIKKLKLKKAVVVKQISHKNRNPNNIVPNTFEKYYQEFLNNSKLDHKLVVVNKKEYALKRIPVQESCLACHGDYKNRPKFIKKKYLKDKAHSFQVGDLRGVYLISNQ